MSHSHEAAIDPPASGIAQPATPHGLQAGADPEEGGGALLRVSELKQWIYCPRVVYWTLLSGLPRPVTRKMEYGHETHAALEMLERRRTFREYGLDRAVRHFRVTLSSASLGLTGTIDLCLETESALYPVEFKDTPGEMRMNHVAQLAAYSLLLEEHSGKAVGSGFWISIPRNQVRHVALTGAVKRRAMDAAAGMRSMLATEELPAPADRWAKCRDCEFLRLCGDRYG